jgi:CRISPR-associated protein, GSU0054 family (Cas_GSU0054).
MLALRLTFPAGRYHATPWGRHVNEGDVEWPPSPWRLVRGLIATWHRKLDPERFPQGRLSDLLAQLAAEAPVYRLPPAVHAHTRHYVPTREGKADKSTLIFDAFARVSKDAELVVAWPGLDLSADQQALLDALLETLGYLGRAESWVEAERLPAWHGTPNCFPGEEAVDRENGEVLDTLSLQLPLAPAGYAAFQASQMDNLAQRKLKKSDMKRIQDTLPESWLAALSLDTADLQRAGWSAPPAARKLHYLRPADTLLPTAPPRRKALSVPAATTVRYALYGKPLPLLTDAVRAAERLRAAAMGKAKRLFGEHGIPPLISGHGVEVDQDNRHGHAFWLPESDGAGRIDAFLVHVPAGMDRATRRALEELDGFKGRDGQEWQLMMENSGMASGLASVSPLCGRGKVFESVTPYLHPWHLKAKFGAEEQIRRECRERGWPEPVVIERLPSLEIGSREYRPVHFHRFRSKKGLPQPDTHGAFLRLVFAEPRQGPVALGFGCHFGLGLFRPAG